jgi:hypothetical protein
LGSPVSDRSDGLTIDHCRSAPLFLEWDGLMLRISFLTILLLTGCQDTRVQNPVVGQIQQIESPLQNTVEGMAETMPPELLLRRLGNLQAHSQIGRSQGSNTLSPRSQTEPD